MCRENVLNDKELLKVENNSQGSLAGLPRLTSRKLSAIK